MGTGLVIYDLLYLTTAALLYGGALSAGAWVLGTLSPFSPAVSWPLAALASLLALILEVGVLTALCPRLRSGSWPFLKSRVFWGWLLRSMLRRVLLLPSLKWILFNSNVLRWLSLRAMGCRIAFTASMSSDVDVLDPSLTTIGAGAIIGMRCVLTGHYIVPGLLVLEPVAIGEKAVLAADVGVAPGVTVGEGALVKPRTTLSVRASVGARAEVGPAAFIDMLGRVGEGANVGTGAYVGVRGLVPDGGRVEAMASASSIKRSAAPAV